MASKRVTYFMRVFGGKPKENQLTNIMKSKKCKGIVDYRYGADSKGHLTMEVDYTGTSLSIKKLLKKVRTVFEKAEMDPPSESDASSSGSPKNTSRSGSPKK